VRLARIAAAVVAMSLAGTARPEPVEGRAAGAGAPPSAGPTVARADQVLRARAGLRSVAAYLATQPRLLDGKRKDLLSRAEKLELWGAWAAAIDHATVLEALRGDPAAFAKSGQDPAALGVSRAAFLASYRAGLDLIALVDRSAAAGKLLDEDVPELGIPAGTFAAYKLLHLNAARATEFAAVEALALRAKAPTAGLRNAIEEDRQAIWKMGRWTGHALTVKNAAAVVGQAGHAVWFPLQKGVSTWMGDTRVARSVESALVSAAQIAALPGRLQPGDILLERREWYLSNLGLPGFWTHAALYVGTPEERRAFFDDPEVRALAVAEGQADGDLEALLAIREPRAAEASRALDAAGHAPRVLEAISEGVSFTSLEHSAAADSVAVLRPNLDRRARALAMLRAFHYAGRPYDFDFDFLTDASLVCSELVYKVYEPGPGMPGVRWALESLAGRKLVSPNAMARQLDDELDLGEPQVDLVVFLDGSEPKGGAEEAGLAAFRASWKRPKWYAVVSR
jgi:hypothetical protein